MRGHPDWPLASLRQYAEELASVESAKPDRVAAYFAEFPPISIGGEIALRRIFCSPTLRGAARPRGWRARSGARADFNRRRRKNAC